MSDRWSHQDFANHQARRGVRIELVDPPKANKYSAIKTEVDGIIFDSKREATRYQELRLMQQHGLIHDLKLQVSYPLIVNEVKIAVYRGDFEYIEDGRQVVEDTKGCKTPVYRLKKKLMKAIYGIEIRET